MSILSINMYMNYIKKGGINMHKITIIINFICFSDIGVKKGSVKSITLCKNGEYLTSIPLHSLAFFKEDENGQKIYEYIK